MMKVVKTKKYKDTIYDHSLWYLKSAFDEPEGCLVDYRHGNVTGKDDCSVYKYDFNVESAESWFRLAHFENVPADHAIDVVMLLANLIDRPTCMNLAEERGMQPVTTVEWFECSSCHTKARQDKIGHPIRYCPYCGKEVAPCE